MSGWKYLRKVFHELIFAIFRTYKIMLFAYICDSTMSVHYLHLTFVILTQAVKLDPVGKKLTLGSGLEISYDKCLLATGGKPKNLPVFSDTSPALKDKISLYRAIPDYQKLDELVGAVGSILVIGGGFLGSELAVGMANRGAELAVII